MSMRILIIGGTRLVGRQIAQAAIDAGHDVTLFNRGKAAPDGLPGTSLLVGDRDSDLSALASSQWDATIDVCAYQPRQVRSLLDTLGDRAGHFTLISTISVFSLDVPDAGFTEDDKLVSAEWGEDVTVTGESYGPLKVACEEAAAELSDRLLIIRPGYVIGPYDYTERFTHWIRAVHAGAPFDAPAADQPLQGVDGRDLGAFTMHCVEQGATDVFNVTAPQDVPTFAQVLDTIAESLGVPLPAVNWTAPDSESEELPLASPPDWWRMMRADLTKATKAGFRWRPLAETVKDTAEFIAL
jgi:2'-hydroxyisoflavone reductase